MPLQIMHNRSWQILVLLGLLDVAFAAGALPLRLCVSVSAVFVTLLIAIAGTIGSIIGREKFASMMVFATIGSLVVAGFSLVRGCITEWRTFQGVQIPDLIVTELISNLWLGAGYALIAALLGCVTFLLLQRLGRYSNSTQNK